VAPRRARPRCTGTVGLGLLSLALGCGDGKDSATTPSGDCSPPEVAYSVYAPAANLGEFAAQLERIRQSHAIPGLSAGIASAGEIVWEAGFGMANVERGIPATPDTTYSLASLTKPFAAVVIMQLVEDGRLDLDTPVSRFGVAVANSQNISVRHLMTHTSEGEPGTSFCYNGPRFGLLDGVIRGASGSSFERLLNDTIVGPLGLAHTVPITSAQRASLGLAQGYCPSGLVPQSYIYDFACSAGLISTVGDYLRFSIALDSHALISPATTDAMLTPMRGKGGTVFPYALGWFVQTIDGLRVAWHYGWWDATSTLVVKVPERELTFVIMANSDMLSRPYIRGCTFGDIMTHAVGRYFLDSFVFGSGHPAGAALSSSAPSSGASPWDSGL
jgi:CubicO group peptidase (beta-lactamase class C family)